MRRVLGRVAVSVALVGVGYGLGRAQGIALLSGVVPAAETKLAEVGPWGEFHSYYEGTTTGTAAVLVGYADINPERKTIRRISTLTRSSCISSRAAASGPWATAP